MKKKKEEKVNLYEETEDAASKKFVFLFLSPSKMREWD